jgi:UDP-glucuronate decarboxylase
MRLMQSAPEFTGPVNIGNDSEVSIRQLAETIVGLADSRSPIVHKPLPEDDPLRRQPDLGLAKRELAWRPTTSLQAGLGRTIAYFDALLAQEGAC